MVKVPSFEEFDCGELITENLVLDALFYKPQFHSHVDVG